MMQHGEEQPLIECEAAGGTAPTITLTAAAEDPLAFATTVAVDPTRVAEGTQELRLGEILGGRYELAEQVGKGAFGKVFRAHDRTADETVAIKVMRYRQRRSPDAIQRLRTELRAARRVTHPGIVRIHDVIDLGDRLALSMEFVEGETLLKRLRREPCLGETELRTLALDLAQALAAAHEVGVVHCDLKPANIILRAGSGRAVIADFGISRLARREDTLSQLSVREGSGPGGSPDGPASSGDRSSGNSFPLSSSPARSPLTELEDTQLLPERRIFGTPLYMAPEIFLGGQHVAPKIDVYALGVVLYEAATGIRPHAEHDLRAFIRARLSGPPPPLNQLRPDLSPELCRVIDGCLIHEPEHRLTSEDVVLMLAPPQALVLSRITGTSLTAARPAQHRRRRILGLALAVAVFGLLLQRCSHSWLPLGERRVWVEASIVGAPPGDWLAQAIARHARHELGAAGHRFRLADTPQEANVRVRLEVRRTARSAQLDVAVGPEGGSARRIADPHAASLAAALQQALPTLTRHLDAGVDDAAADDSEAAAMQRLGARSPEAHRRYGRALDTYFGAVLPDLAAVEAELTEAMRLDPDWPHPHAALVLAQGHTTPRALATLERARRAVAGSDRDPLGRTLLEALVRASEGRAREAVQLLAEALKPAPTDLLGLQLLGTLYALAQRPDEQMAILGRLHALRPDLRFGAELEAALLRAGRPDEAAALAEAWFARAPESESSLGARIALDLAAGRNAEAEQRARDLLWLYGEAPHRLLVFCDTLIAIGRTSEARIIATRLVSADERWRGLGRYRLGVISVLEGRLGAAHDELELAAAEERPYGVESDLLPTLEALISLDGFLGETRDLARHLVELEGTLERFGDGPGAAAARFQRALLGPSARSCPEIDAALAGISDPSARATARRALLRLAASAGCIPCDDALRAGLSADERSSRSLFHFARCAEWRGAPVLAADVFRRAAAPLLSSLVPVSDFAPDRAVLSHFHLGRLLERMDRPAEARAEYERFLAAWGHADRPLAEVDEARQALARLR